MQEEISFWAHLMKQPTRSLGELKLFLITPNRYVCCSYKMDKQFVSFVISRQFVES